MSHRSRAKRGVAVRRHGVLAVLGIGLAAGLPACNLLEQETPDLIAADDLTDPSNADLLVRSAFSALECALAQHVLGTGLLGDELDDASVSEPLWDYDRRTLNPARAQYASGSCGSGVPTNYMDLSRARYQADFALRLLDGWTDEQVPNRMGLIAQAAAYGGYSLVMMAESFCSGAIDLGPELSPADMFGEAIKRFDRAIEAGTAANDTATVTLARLGRARARLGLGDLEGAGADAALIPEGFVVNATYSDAATRRQNRVHTALYRTPIATVSAAYRNLTFDGVPDPRVEVIDAGRSGMDADVPLFQPAKYSSVSSPIPLATWEEAQLILAEARLAAGDTDGAVAIINRLHGRVGLPPYAGGTPDEVRAQIIEERRRELFLEGHRLGDMIRYGIPLDPPPGTPFRLGGLYGDQRCFPLPDIERQNNPNL